MRRAALVLLVLTLAVPAGFAAARVPGGTLSITDARGTVVVKGRGAVLGRIDRGMLQIVDLSPADAWSPRINGIPRGRLVGTKGRELSFYVPGGRYRIVARGEGINVSARGAGLTTLDGEPDPSGATGMYGVGDAAPTPVPDITTRVRFGAEEVAEPEPARSRLQP
jgi:hypothetical protein